LRLAERGEATPPLAVRAHLAHLRGLRARDDADADTKVEASLREAIELFSRWGSVPMRARAEADLGSWLRLQGRHEAEELINSARERFAELGAIALLEELDGQLETTA
jgi:hypothetical protein